MNPEDQATIDHWQTQAYLARHRLDVADSAMVAAQDEYHRAVQAFEESAQRAIGLIDASFDGTNDGLLDHVGHASRRWPRWCRRCPTG